MSSVDCIVARIARISTPVVSSLTTSNACFHRPMRSVTCSGGVSLGMSAGLQCRSAAHVRDADGAPRLVIKTEPVVLCPHDQTLGWHHVDEPPRSVYVHVALGPAVAAPCSVQLHVLPVTG